MKQLLLWVATGCLLCGRWGAAGNWPQWRGPNLDGSAPEERGLPARLDESTLRWSADLPGHSASTPIVCEDRVLVSSLEKGTPKLLAMCFDRASGKLLWRKEAGSASGGTAMNNLGSPSPVTDGRSVIFHYGNGLLAAFTMDGDPLWTRDVCADHGQFNYLFLYSSSPLLHKGKLYVQAIHRDTPYGKAARPGKGESYLLAIDAATGKDLWRQLRATDALNESQESYATPIPFSAGGREEVVIIGGDHVTGHAAEDGRELWRCGGWNPRRINHWRLIPSVVAAGELLIACAPKGGPVLGIRGGGMGTITDTHIAWRSAGASTDAATPLFYNGHLYVLDGDKKALACVNPADGKARWSAKFDSTAVVRTSPTGADGKIYFMDEAGDVFVASAEDGKVLSRTSLGSDGRARASVVAAGGMLFVRTGTKLYAYRGGGTGR